jgi:hypothetical protein
MFAAVITLAAPSAASAYVRTDGGGPNAPTRAVVQHHSGDSIDWVIGIGAAGGLAAVGAGVATKRHRGQKPRPSTAAPAA